MLKKRNRYSKSFVKSIMIEMFAIVICRRRARIFKANIFLEVGDHVLLILNF